MSNDAQNWAWSIKGLKPAEMLVLLKIADYADENHSSFPGIEHLAEKCNISARSVITHIQKLEQMGLVRVERRFTADGARTSNRYILPVDLPRDSGSASPALGGLEADPEARDQGSEDSASGAGHQVQNPVDQVQTAALYEPSAFNHYPPTPTPWGSGPIPHPNILAALEGKPLAAAETRVCKKHARQRSSCIDCWTLRPLTFKDIPWCGTCMQDTRQELINPDDIRAGVRRCPRCNPRGMTPEALEERMTAIHPREHPSRGQGKDFAIPRGDR